MKSGFITIIGRPNVGKSTLLNKLLGQKIVIATDKPHGNSQTASMGIFTVIHLISNTCNKKRVLTDSFNWLGKDDVIRTFANILINDFRYPNKEMKSFLEILNLFY